MDKHYNTGWTVYDPFNILESERVFRIDSELRMLDIGTRDQMVKQYYLSHLDKLFD